MKISAHAKFQRLNAMFTYLFPSCHTEFPW